MLQEFLNQNFIIIAEDSNVDKLKKACDDVVKRINKNKSKIITYTLVAFDPEIPAENPEVNEVKELIIKHWNTFVSNSKDTPITYTRAVMLEVLQTISKDIDLACLIWHTGRNVIKYYTLGREKDLLINFLLELGKRVEQHARAEWSDSIESEMISGDVKPLTEPINKVEIDDNFQFLKKNITQNQLDFVQFNKVLLIRTQLLWWKETCYSLSLKKSYRELKKGLLPISLAYDYSEFVPFIYPISADYFLKEVHINLIQEENKKLKMSEIFRLIDESKIDLQKIFTEYTIEEGRISLLNFIKGLIWDKYSVKQFKSLVGITSSIEIDLVEFTLWIFHDLQSLKIALNK